MKRYACRYHPTRALAVLICAAAWSAPYLLIWVIIIAYMCHIPFAVRSRAGHEVWDQQAQATAVMPGSPGASHRPSMARRSQAGSTATWTRQLTLTAG